MNVLCFDFGLQRVGFAYASGQAGIAFPGGVFINDDRLFSNVEKLVKEKKAELILVGKPYRSDGSVGHLQEQIDLFVDELLLLGPEVRLIDERFTSKIADQRVLDMGLSKSKREEPRDDIAAQIILEAWLEQRH